MSAAADQARILVIDDYPSVIATLEYMLPAFGYAVLTAGDGMSGLEMAERQRVDLILVDFHMPFFGGVDVLRALRAHPTLSRIPALVMTGCPSREVVELATGAGARAVVAKPIDFEKLAALLGEHLSAGGAEGAGSPG